MAAVVAISTAATACQSSRDEYGSAPSFLPSSQISADSVLTGTTDRPALTSEGDTVLVELAHGSALVTVTGPIVPGEGLPHPAATTTCTWTVTMRRAVGTVPLRLGDFTALDHLGGVSHPSVLAGHRPPPSVLRPGQTVRFQMRAVMRTGEGVVRWAPPSAGTEPGHILASWDFTVEND